MRVMGIDFGRKRIGIAISDELGMAAFPKGTISIEDNSDEIESIRVLAQENNVREIVVGLPLNMDGTEGGIAKETREFIGRLKKKISIPIQVIDERLSSSQIERFLIDADISRKKRKSLSDKLSAQIILQSYLDRKKYV